MSGVLLDVRHAVRLVWIRSGFSLLVVFTLALGIGANAALFSVLDAVWVRALPSAHCRSARCRMAR